MRTDRSIIYHIYPLGFCAVEPRNSFTTNPVNRISKIENWLPHIKSMGCDTLLLGPVWEASAHGYDTADFFHLDRRLGSNEDFKSVAKAVHAAGMNLVLDGVFNHVGREFWAFRDVRENKKNSRYCDWFLLNWNGNNHYDDGFYYQNWEGCSDLVKLNLKNQDVKNHLFEAIKSWTDNLLTYHELNFITGLENNWVNGGSLENKGYNITVNGHIVATRDWNWEVGASVGHYTNELTALPDGQNYVEAEVYGATIRSQIGQPVNMFYGYKTAPTSTGTYVYSTSEEAAADGLYILAENGIDRNYFGAGDVKFQDKDGYKEINSDDRQVIGDPNPDIYGNIFTSLSWKRLRLDVNFNYSLGNDAYNYQRAQLEGGNRFMNQTVAMVNRWSYEGQVTDMPKAEWNDPMGNARFSDRWIEDASYLRLKSITLSYELPINNTFLHGLTFWGQANNVFTVSKYLGLDPEFSMSNSVLEQGIDRGLLANSRNFMIGIKINL